MVWTSLHEYILLGVDSVIIGILVSVCKRRDKIVKELLEAPSVSVGSELDNLFESSNAKEIPYGIIRGRIQELGNKVIESSSGLKGVLQIITLNEHSVRRMGFGNWNDSVRLVSKTQNTVPFGIKSLDFLTDSMKVEVENPWDANMDNFLLRVSTNFTPSSTSLVSTIFGFFTGVASKGIETSEDLMPVDTIVTGVGRIVKSSNGHLKLTEPKGSDYIRPYILSTLPIEGIIKKMEGKTFKLKLASFFFITVGAVVLIRRLWELWKKRNEAKMKTTILKNRNRTNLDKLTEDQTCIVCLVNPREVILLNCGHVCVCADCCGKLKDTCPVCRSAVTSIHIAYLN